MRYGVGGSGDDSEKSSIGSMPKKTTRLDKTRLPAKQSGLEGRSGTFKVARYVVYDDTIIAVRISTNDNDINNNYKIYMKGQAKGIQVERWKWSCKGVSSVTGRRTVLYKMLPVSC